MTEQRRKITRTRETLACSECSRRKLKCDHSQPCSNCIKGNSQAACKYQKYGNGRSAGRERRTQAEARLEHLEQLVQELSQANGKVEAPVTGSPAHTSAESNAVATTGDHAYAGSTHWSAMLRDIEDLRDVLNDDHSTDPQGETSSTDIIFGATTALPYDQILHVFLPTRQEADRLTATYFQSRALVAPFLHSAQFMRQYRRFWEDPLHAPPLWTSILFSMYHVVVIQMMEPQGDRTAANRFTTAAAHCLVAGRYNKQQKFSVESLLFYLQSQCITCLEIPDDIGTLFGSLVRLATKMGYHRDPDHFSYSPFESEIRRRVWSLCMQLDLLMSFQLGLPSNVQYPTWDTRCPTNLEDGDIDEDSKVMPPSRPDTEVTDIGFYNAKHKLMVVFEKILRHALNPSTDKIGELDVLNSELDATYFALPPLLHPLPLSDSIVDSPTLVVCRLCVYFIYAKCRCVLHRPYAASGNPESVQICYDASSGLVGYFLNAYVEFQTGGQRSSERWFLSSISWNDFLLANMVLCLVVCVSSRNNLGWQPNMQGTMSLLEEAHATCKAQEARSKGTKRVTKVLESVLLRFKQTGPIDGNGTHIQPSPLVNTPASGESSGSQVLTDSNDSAFSNSEPPSTWDTSGLNASVYDEQMHSIDDISWKYIEDFLRLPVDTSMDF